MSLQTQLEAIEHMALATAAMARGIVDGLEPPSDPTLAPPPPGGPCMHPEDKRVSTAAMGRPNAFRCMACNEEINP